MKKISLLLILAFLLFPFRCAHALDVLLRDQVTITTGGITLGDIATLQPQGPEADVWARRTISQAPAPGEAKILQSSSVISSLRHYDGFPALRWLGSSQVIVRRAGQEIDQEQLRRMIMDFLHENLKNLPEAELRLTGFRAPSRIVLPTGPVEHTIKPSKPGILGSSSFGVLFSQNGRTIKNVTVHARLEAVAEVVTAATTIRRGAIISAADVQVVRQDISRLNDPYPSIRMVVGLQAIRNIRAGRPLDASNVAPPPVVRKGQAVKILARRGALTISTRGVAIMDGRPGDFIRVKNISSNKLVYCRVDAPGVVSVEF